MIYNIIKKIVNLNRDKGSLIKHPSVKVKSSDISGNVIIRNNAKIINGVKISSLSKIKIGKYSVINGPNTFINSYINEINIGNFCSIASGVTIQEFNHHTNRISTFYINKNILNRGSKDDVTSKGDITIGHDVWVGSNSTILSGVKIGDGSIIAANSVVTKNVPEFSIFGGNPAQLIRYRFSRETIDYIKKLKWWYWGEEKIKNNHRLFTCDSEEISHIKIV